MYYDLNNKKTIKVKDSIALKFLYNTILGRIILKIATTHLVANIYANYMNSKLSKHKIKKFIKKNNINMDDYELVEYKSFNDFFMRNIKADKRTIEDGIIPSGGLPKDTPIIYFDVIDSCENKVNLGNKCDCDEKVLRICVRVCFVEIMIVK